jgi:hypothetical protein
MKTGNKRAEDPPQGFDPDAWRAIAAEDGLGRIRPEDIVAAIQRIGPKGDQKLLRVLMLHISDEITKRLRKRIGAHHRNDGNDIIGRAHEKLISAVLKPNSADGKGLRKKFGLYVRYRADDAIVEEMRERTRYTSYEINEAGDTVEPRDDSAAPDHVEQVAYVENLLSKITDPRKCLAFRLHMDGCPLGGSKGTASIARALDIDEKTAGEWIEEVQDFLKKLGVADDRT